MPIRNTFQQIALELSRVLTPLRDVTSSPDEFAIFMLTELGWDVNRIPQPVLDLIPQIQRLVVITQDIEDTGEISYSKLAEITSNLAKLIGDIHKISNAPNANADLSPSLIADQFMQKLPDELMQYLFVEYLWRCHPISYAGLKLLGIIATEPVTSATSTRLSHEKWIVNWSYFSDILTEPQDIFHNVYGGGDLDLNFSFLIYNVADFLAMLGFRPFFQRLDNKVAMVLEGKDDPELNLVGKDDPELNLIKDHLKLPFAASDIDIDKATSIGLFPLPKSNTHKPGFAILPHGNASTNIPEKITDSLSFVFQTGFDDANGIGIIIRPGEEIKVLTGFKGGTCTSARSGFFKTGILFAGGPNKKMRLLTASEGIFLEIASLNAYGGIDFLTNGCKDLFIEFELKDGKLAISAENADGFLSAILPKDGITANFDLTIGMSSLRGAYFRGSGGLEIQIPVHINLGLIDIPSVTFSLPIKDDALSLNVGANIKATLGPLKVVIENIGLTAELALPALAANGTFPADRGNLGPLNFSLGFKTPQRIGLDLDTGTVKGGGYLDFDPKKEEYSGTLELVVSGWLNLKGFGLINTRLPGGQPGFSMLVIITADFGDTGYQLGYGFTLLKVGGLLGLNRTLKLEALAEGIRTNAISSLMFPKDVVTNAPRIISDLRAIFPPQENTFLIAPMAEIGWGTPTLIRVSLGVIIELPSSNIAIVGVLKVALPSEQTPLLAINVGFLGVIQPSKSRLWFFARLFDSHLLGITIEGEAGLLMAWGDKANFVFSVGGFHPSFTPPPLPFPVPERITLNILDHDNARIRISGYFAVTSNTVQFGAKAELYFGFSAFNVSGNISFDALLQLSPFYFMVQISCHLSLKVFGIGLFGIDLDLSLEGPTPWHVQGYGSLRILFFTIRVPIDITWGESHDTSLPDIDIMRLAIEEFKKPQNWTAELPDSYNLLVTMRKLDEAPGVIILHPLGTLRVSQRLVPLDAKLDKIGNKKIKDYRKLTVDSSDGFKKSGDTKEMFAMAQFQELSDADKLSLPSYQKQNSGLLMSESGQQLSSSHMIRRVIRYETVIIDTNYRRSELTLVGIYKGLFTHSLNSNAVTKSALSKARKRQLDPFEEKEKVKLKPESYTVVLASTNQAYPGATAEATAFESESLAREYMQKQIRKDPNRADLLQVIPTSEVC